MSKFFTLLILTLSFSFLCSQEPKIGWREDFEPTKEKLEGWQFEGGKLFTPKTQFSLSDGSLHVKADKSTGVYMVKPGVDLRKYPILRWRWRVKNLAPNADGRTKLDDQALAIYVGFGGILSRKTVVYRWETETPKGYWGKTVYGKGIVDVNYKCLQNKSSEMYVWYEEERNILEDIERFYGEIPAYNDYVISVGANSQYTKSNTHAELDYIELIEKK